MTTFSQIYLSRGVAGTKSEPVLPQLNTEPVQVASFFESSSIHRLSLSPIRPTSHMSQTREPMPEASNPIDTNLEHLNEQSVSPSNDDHDTPTTRRSEVLRHVFPRSTRLPPSADHRSPSRISRRDHYRSAVLYARQLRPRGTFHRVISSFFGGNAERGAHSASPQSRSRASSFGSRPGSSVHGSVPSLDLVSPGIFLFSGPSLQSAGSHNNSRSRLPSLTESSDETYLRRRFRTGSFSIVDRESVEEVLEPVDGPPGVVRSMSDVLLGVNTPIEEPTDPLLQSSENGIDLMDQNIAQGDTSSHKSSWPDSIPIANELMQDPTSRHEFSRKKPPLRVAPSPGPPSSTLPAEILVGIYSYLHAKDFNAARRTCRMWMMASLNKSLLTLMLARGGWSEDYALKTFRLGTENRSTASYSQAWNISRCLSRQCALASHWTGNGLDAGPAIVESTEVDFSDFADGYAPPKGRANGGLIFTASTCGKYLLAVKNTLIYIYGMKDGLLQPLTSVVCPRRVLSVSMNTSVGRDAVAALLEGRMGMVCELRYGRPSPEPASGDTCVEGDGYPPRTSAQPGMATGDTSDLQYAIDSAEHTSPRVLRSFSYVRNPDLDTFNAIELKAHDQGFSLRGTDDPNTHDPNMINQTWNLDLRGPIKDLRTKSDAILTPQSIPIESGTSTFYRHLCSEDDPPRNVSICPQRRCVAFSCAAGIELHWIDALTGQSLSRWFPLTSPSDHLYFLSPRPGFESAKKLRLISSVAHPVDRPALHRKFFPNPIANSIWSSFAWESRRRSSNGCDHLQAVPLSDGHHVLFIDPSNDRLVLGCDAPLSGPTKLLRKVILNPPENTGSQRQSTQSRNVPRFYTAAADMSSGARVVVAYGDTIMLYGIPPDILALSILEQAAESGGVYNAPPLSPDVRPHDHWLNWWDESIAFDPANRSEGDNDSPIWPINLSGTEIGRLSDLCELAIQTRPDITIWAFTYTSQCKTWRLRNYANPVVRAKQVVDRSGLVHDSHSRSMDGRQINIHDAPPNWVGGCAITLHVEGEEWETPAAERSVIVGFDGSASGVLKRVPRALAMENDGWVDGIDVRGCKDAWFEGSGDVASWWEV